MREKDDVSVIKTGAAGRPAFTRRVGKASELSGAGGISYTQFSRQAQKSASPGTRAPGAGSRLMEQLFSGSVRR